MDTENPAFALDKEPLTPVEVAGFSGGALAADIRGHGSDRLDLAILLSECPCTVAGTFTRNRMAAAPVRICRDLLNSGVAPRGLLVNSGNANACTGARGMEDATAMQEAAAQAFGLRPEEVFVCSTGRIGEPLPMDRIHSGIQRLATATGSTAAFGEAAADAILTSDTCRKVASVTVPLSAGPVRIAGMAKGAGMIEPNMATMLAFLTTDGIVEQDLLQSSLGAVVEESFNAITVDGDESTNDTVLFLASGASGVECRSGTEDAMHFREALRRVCRELAARIVGDGERITKVVEIQIQEAANDAEAGAAARAIGNSLLVKTSWYGNDPNWGRLMDALGYSGARVEEETVTLGYAPAGGGEEVPVFTRGHCHVENKPQWKRMVAEPRFRIVLRLGQGEGKTRLLATDLSEGYVDFNKSE